MKVYQRLIRPSRIYASKVQSIGTLPIILTFQSCLVPKPLVFMLQVMGSWLGNIFNQIRTALLFWKQGYSIRVRQGIVSEMFWKSVLAIHCPGYTTYQTSC